MQAPLYQQSSTPIPFSNGQVAQAMQVQTQTDLPFVLEELGLSRSRPVLVLIGGASNLAQDDYQRLQRLFVESLAPLAEELDMIVIDGATDAGIVQLMGLARSEIGATFPLVGVAPIGKVYSPHVPTSTGTHSLEPHHTHFIFTPGDKWGDESPWIAEIASVLSNGVPSATVLMNGGTVSLIDVKESVEEGRPVVVIAGTGRLADEIATAVRHPGQEMREALCPIIRTGVKVGSFQLYDLAAPSTQLTTSLKQYFCSKLRSLASSFSS